MTLYQWIRTLSLDIVAGSLAGGTLFAWLFYAPEAMPWSWWCVLALSVWIIYTADHLLDARRLGADAGTPRHRFHYRHFRALALALFLAATGSLALTVLPLPRPLVLSGLWLGGGALLHLLCAQLAGRIAYPAELVIAMLYTAGIGFAPLVLANAIGQPTIFAWHCTTLFFLAALGNLIAFSLFEATVDRREAPGRLLALMGITGARLVLLAIAPLSLLFAGAAAMQTAGAANPAAEWTAIGVLLLACLLPPIVYATREFGAGYLAQRERYRAICDAVFVLYLVPPLVAWLTG